MNRIRRIFFSAILICPALALLVIMTATAFDIYSLRRIDPDGIFPVLKAHLAEKDPVSFPLPDTIFTQDRTRKTVFVFGESSLVITDGKTFPDYLGQDHSDLTVVNFGVSGIDSFSIQQRVGEALSVAKPDIIVLYYGHNDFNNAYQGFIVPRYFEKFTILVRLSYVFHDRSKPIGVIIPEEDEYYWYSRFTRPKLLQAAQQVGVFFLDSAEYARINQLIVDYFVLNTDAIITMASKRRIPVVLITPVGNLRAEPYGDKVATEYYRKGMTARDYRQSLEYLRMARDREVFTYDLRAKSQLVQSVREWDQPGVYPLDLERELEERHFSFGYADFLDYFHLNDGSHKLLADIIYDFMKLNHLVGSGRN